MISQFGFDNYFFNYMKWKKDSQREKEGQQRCK